MVQFYNILKNGYSKKKQQQYDGYVLDNKLSNHNNQVYYNQLDRKMIMNVNGTNSFSDWGTDAALIFGGLKLTNRYLDSERILKDARSKYRPKNVSLTGHSLGSKIVSLIASKGAHDKVITLDGAYTGSRINNNERAYRTSGDIVSTLNGNSKHMTTLINPHIQTESSLVNMLNSHNIQNIKNDKIFV